MLNVILAGFGDLSAAARTRTIGYGNNSSNSSVTAEWKKSRSTSMTDNFRLPRRRRLSSEIYAKVRLNNSDSGSQDRYIPSTAMDQTLSGKFLAAARTATSRGKSNNGSCGCAEWLKWDNQLRRSSGSSDEPMGKQI